MQRAKELVLLAEVIDASRAYEMGLVNRVVPRADLDAVVGEFVDKLRTGPPIALATSKKLLNQSFSSTLEEALEAKASGRHTSSPRRTPPRRWLPSSRSVFPRFLGR